MILSFSVFKEKIEDGTKTQTIRRYSEFQYNRFCNAKKYQLYWHNPRNGGKLIKEVEAAEKPFTIYFHLMGIHFCPKKSPYLDQQNIAPDLFAPDGFSNVPEMWDWFKNKYGDILYQKPFMVIRWKP